MSSGFNIGKRATKSRVGLWSDSTSERLMPQEMASPPSARQSAGKNGFASLAHHGGVGLATEGVARAGETVGWEERLAVLDQPRGVAHRQDGYARVRQVLPDADVEARHDVAVLD